MKKRILLVTLVLCLLACTGCDSARTVKKYNEAVTDFYTQLTTLNNKMNNLDYDSPLAQNELMEDMDSIIKGFDELGRLTPPSKYTDIKILTDEGKKDMQLAKEYYKTYFNDVTDLDSKSYGDAYYEGAMKCVRYIGCYLSGTDPNANENMLPKFE